MPTEDLQLSLPLGELCGSSFFCFMYKNLELVIHTLVRSELTQVLMAVTGIRCHCVGILE